MSLIQIQEPAIGGALDGNLKSLTVQRIDVAGANGSVSVHVKDLGGGWGAYNIINPDNNALRWAVGVSGTEDISGAPANSGSDLSIWRYDDNGGVVDRPLSISRASGQVNLKNVPLTVPVSRFISVAPSPGLLSPQGNPFTIFSLNVAGDSSAANFFVVYANITGFVASPGQAAPAYDVYLSDTLNALPDNSKCSMRWNTGAITNHQKFNNNTLVLAFQSPATISTLYVNILQTNTATSAFGQPYNLSLNANIIGHSTNGNL